MNKEMACYEYIAKTIQNYGITHVFYMEAMLRMAIREMDANGMTCVETHSEGAAGYMADGYARATGKPGICMCQSIGAGNMVGGVYDAYLANSPVIAMTGKKVANLQYKNAYQEADHRLLFEGITKFNAEVLDPAMMPFLLRQCFRAVTTGKARPAHLDVPNRVGRTTETATIKEPLYIEETYRQYPAYRPAATQAQIEEAVKALVAAEKPIIVAGRGATLSGAHAEIYELASKGDIPVATSPDGKAVIDEMDGLWAGIAGDYGMACANTAVTRADLVIFIGTQTSDQTTYDWKAPVPTTRVVQIDIDPSELGKNYPDTVGLPGDAKVVAKQLADAIGTQKRPDWRAEVAGYVKETLDEYEALLNIKGDKIRPDKLCREVEKALPDDAILVSDTGFSAVWSAIAIRMKPSQKYLRAAGSLGWSYPASLGVKCGIPERPVICFTGDGAFFYHLSEMETAVRYGINTVTVINNNQALGQCSKDLSFVCRDDTDKGERYYSFKEVNFSEVAKAFGCLGVRVWEEDRIGPELEKALKADKPTVIEVMTDKSIITPPPFK